MLDNKFWRDLEKVYAEDREVSYQCIKTNNRIRYVIEFSDPNEANLFEEKLNSLRRIFRPSKAVGIRVADTEE